jgi:hypothetical protein
LQALANPMEQLALYLPSICLGILRWPCPRHARKPKQSSALNPNRKLLDCPPDPALAVPNRSLQSH